MQPPASTTPMQYPSTFRLPATSKGFFVTFCRSNCLAFSRCIFLQLRRRTSWSLNVYFGVRAGYWILRIAAFSYPIDGQDASSKTTSFIWLEPVDNGLIKGTTKDKKVGTTMGSLQRLVKI